MSRKSEISEFAEWSLIAGVTGGITLPLLILVFLVFQGGWDTSVFLLWVALAIAGILAGIGSGIVIGFLFNLLYRQFHLQMLKRYRLSLYTAASLSFIISSLFLSLCIGLVFNS